MKLYLDDVRKPPKGWSLVKTVSECIFWLENDYVTELSLDHDLGTKSTGYDVLLWIEKQVFLYNWKPPKIRIHTSNTSAAKKMKQAICRINKEE